MIGNASGNMFGMAGNTQHPPAVVINFCPHGAACAAPVRNRVHDTTQWNFDAMFERRCPLQPVEARCNPGAVFLGELTGFPKAAARRNSENCFARDCDDA